MPDGSSGGAWDVSGGEPESAARSRFAALVARPAIPLAEAALAIAEEEYPRLDAARYLVRLDELARDATARLSGCDASSMLRALRATLFGEAGLRGNTDDYYDPRNSFLNEVLDRRLGIPITLSVVYLEVASRIGFAVEGVPLPGHFMVRYVAGDRAVFVDAFRGGELLSADDVAARHAARSPGHDLDAQAFPAATPHQILTRMLRNLKGIYLERSDDARALWAIDRLLILDPGEAAERRDHGLISARLGGTRAAIDDLEAYLAAEPAAEDAEQLRGLIASLRGSARTRPLN